MVWPWKIKDNANIKITVITVKITVWLNATTTGPLKIPFPSSLLGLGKQAFFRYSEPASGCCIQQGCSHKTHSPWMDGMLLVGCYSQQSSDHTVLSVMLSLPKRFLETDFQVLSYSFKHPQWWLLSSLQGGFDFMKQLKVIPNLS